MPVVVVPAAGGPLEVPGDGFSKNLVDEARDLAYPGSGGQCSPSKPPAASERQWRAAVHLGINGAKLYDLRRQRGDRSGPCVMTGGRNIPASIFEVHSSVFRENYIRPSPGYLTWPGDMNTLSVLGIDFPD